ncbi:MAG: hypothetical protein HQK79_21190 [Desulfobacterales bacterium]|nr:hypothetical protein [Desulfobacterales bacterium]
MAKTDKLKQAAIASYLYANNLLKSEKRRVKLVDVADVMGIDKSYITKLLEIAQEEGFLKINYELNIPAELQSAVFEFVDINEKRLILMEKYNLEDCVIVPGKYSRFLGKLGPAYISEAFMNTAADKLRLIIQNIIVKQSEVNRRINEQRVSQNQKLKAIEPNKKSLLLTSWGRTLFHIIDRMMPIDGYHEIDVRSIIGNHSLPVELEKSDQVVYEKTVRYSANTIARHLARKLNYPIPPLHILTVASFKANGDIALHKPLLSSDRALMELYSSSIWDKSDSGGLIHYSGTFISSVGEASLSAKLGYKTPQREVIGELSGIPFDKEAKQVPTEEIILGPNLSHIQNIFKRNKEAKESKKTLIGSGVIIFACANLHKVNPLLVLLRTKSFINQLIIDEPIADEIIRIEKLNQ